MTEAEAERLARKMVRSALWPAVALKRVAIANELRRKRAAGWEVPGTEWLRKWTDETLAACEDQARLDDGHPQGE